MDTFQPISASAVHVLARLAARKAVQEQLRADGVRVSLVKPAEISVRANEYLASHPELWKVALERAQRAWPRRMNGARLSGATALLPAPKVMDAPGRNAQALV